MSADLPGHRRADRLRVRRAGRARATCWCSSTPARSGRSSPPPRRQRKLARLNLERMQRAARRRASPRRPSSTGRRPSRSRPRRGSARSAPPSSARRIRAPFAGVLGIRQVNLGQYLNGGDPVVPLQSLDPIYVNFAVPQQEVGALAVGAEVRVTAEGLRGRRPTGRITAVDSVVDEATRNVQVQATFDNPSGTLASRHVRRGAGAASAAAQTVHRAAGLGDQLRALRRLGVRRRGRRRARTARATAACASRW